MRMAVRTKFIFRLGRDDALALRLVGLPVAPLVLPRAVPERLARRTLPLRRLRASREPALHESCRERVRLKGELDEKYDK